MPRLRSRLRAVADQICCRVHADIGADHGQLLATALRERRAHAGIAIENKPTPFRHALATLGGLPNAEVRFADGLAGLSIGECDSLSICGIGGLGIVNILDAHPDRLPVRLILQPNSHAAAVRRWALNQRFHIIHETLVGSKRRFLILTFAGSNGSATDPAYAQLDLEAALEYGPLLLRRNDTLVRQQMRSDRAYIERLAVRSQALERRLSAIRRVLD
jgi:tRNA (adenine22-N1)-methyltransferase